MMADEDSLEAGFAAELRRRQAAAGTGAAAAGGGSEGEETFSGIREIVLDKEGNPMSIPKRDAPPPATTMSDEVTDLLTSPLFAFGVLISLGSLVLILAIAAADSSA